MAEAAAEAAPDAASPDGAGPPEEVDPLAVGAQFVPPDGGLRAWLVMLASFLCNGIIFGIINSGGVIYDALLASLEEKGVPNPATKASMTQAFAIGTTFLLSMPAGVLTDKLGIRLTTLIGGVLATSGMLLSSMIYQQVDILIISYGIIFGLGSSLAYTPSLVILGHYFKRWIGLVNGFVTAGSSLSTITLSALLKYFVDEYGLQATYQLLAALVAVLIVCGIIFKPLVSHGPKRRPAACPSKSKGICYRIKGFIGQFVNFEIWKNRRYAIWALTIPTALFGYFVPYVHLITYVKLVLGQDVNAVPIIQCLGITSGIGRLFFGYIADRPWVNCIFLQQISFFCIGSLTMLLTVANNFYVFMAIALGMGLFDGCFISLLGPIAFDIVGTSGASQAIGCLLALCSIPLTIGPTIAGKLYDILDDYTVPFICAGIPPIVGSLVLFTISCSKRPQQVDDTHLVKNAEEKQNNEELLKPSHLNQRDSNISRTVEDMSTVPNDDVDEIHIDVTSLLMAQQESRI